ncbi:glycosyl transferase [Vibrio sp. 10N.286.49.B3]|uniref:glycosyltransferase family 4 protein n=1 Tax=Vibrio sp. 10N.286.49.B3 TaxID=1880855 RepID=UPI000C8277CC|nr:glycosyltransferase family 4 protein [Vibrio sp. 10N.286.49.B3]PMH45986.1 glycosyl transferase [Vibrio sp. 10N.286.49.B3]
MKICHVNLASGFSGGERQTLQLIKQQLREGYQLTVVANPKSPFADAIRELGCKLVLATHFTRQHKKSITQECQLIHVHEGRAIYWALIQSTLFSIPYIVTRRIDNPLKNKWLSTKAYDKASAVIGLSNEIVARVKDRHPNATLFKIPSSPVAYPVEQNQVDTIWRQFANKFLVIQAANLLKHKGHDVTLAAAKQLQELNPNIHIALLGDGPQREALEQYAQEHQLTNVTFVGKQHNMGDWFASADLLIHPSYTEGLGSVILEAIQGGLPVIGTDAGGIPDIIDHNQSGLLVPAGNSDELAQAIQLMATDKPLRHRLLTGAKEKLTEFDIEQTSALYRSVYQSVTEEA